MTRKTLLFAALALAAVPVIAQQRAATGQLETAEAAPDQTYENAVARNAPGTVDARGAGGGPTLRTQLPAPTPIAADVPALAGPGENRAVTTEPAKAKWHESKWVTAGANAALFGVLGFLAAGPWGALAGVLGGGLVGYGLHGCMGGK